MVRCEDFYRKWEKEPNFCNKCASSVSQINSYLRVIEDLEALGVDREEAFKLIPEGKARPIFTLKPDMRKARIDDIAKLIKEGDIKLLDLCIQEGAGGVARCLNFRAAYPDQPDFNNEVVSAPNIVAENREEPVSKLEATINTMRENLDSQTLEWKVRDVHAAVLKLSPQILANIVPGQRQASKVKVEETIAHLHKMLDALMVDAVEFTKVKSDGQCDCVLEAEYTEVKATPSKFADDGFVKVHPTRTKKSSKLSKEQEMEGLIGMTAMMKVKLDALKEGDERQESAYNDFCACNDACINARFGKKWGKMTDFEKERAMENLEFEVEQRMEKAQALS